MCDDILPINLTQANMSESRRSLIAAYREEVDSMEYHQLLVLVVREMLLCRGRCVERMATVNGQLKERYVSSHFDHLQFVYYKSKRCFFIG